MSIGSLVVGGGTLVAAAEVATWCFKAAARSERQYRHDFASRERAHRGDVVRREREERRQIVRETRRRLAQEAYEQRSEWLDMLTECMESVWEMRNHTRELRCQFLEIVRANSTLLKTSPLTFPQQEAIRDCNFHLERGMARLQAYAGPYLQQFIDEIQEAKRAARGGRLIQPDMPDAVLPDDFPVAGDNLRLSAEEVQSLLFTGRVALGGGQFGHLAGRRPNGIAGEVDAFVEEHDRDTSCWRLSLARGTIATASAASPARGFEATLLSSSRGGFRAAWHSPYGESIELFLPFGLAEPNMRSAPWGTRLPVYVHHTDYLTRRIVVGQQPPSTPEDLGTTVVIEAATPQVWAAIERALEVSPSTFWLTPPPTAGKAGGTLFLRVATGEEFAVEHDGRGVLRVGEQSGYRLGNVDGAICRSYVGLELAGAGKTPSQGWLAADAFLTRIRSRLEEQEELQRVFNEESLETRKYQLLLEAELEANRSSSRMVFAYTDYHLAAGEEDVDEAQEITFLVESCPEADLNGYAVEVVPASPVDGRRRLCGFVRAVDRGSKSVTCSFLDESLRPFLNRDIDTDGQLECSHVDVDTQRQVRALEQFRNVSFLQGKSTGDREAFQHLRRVLLGLEHPGERSPCDQVPPGTDHMNPDQQRAVRLINSGSPLTLILGPPGTGKTDTIAVALEVFLRGRPDARVAVVSQANVAVDEALRKLRDRYPDCDIVRHVSARAVEALMDSSRDLTQHARRDGFVRQLTAQPNLPEWAAGLRDRFRHECTDERFLSRRVLKALVQASAVYGCTLSILGRLSQGTPLFDIVVVDEAAKASLPECMIAALSAKRVVLVGDHHQLLPFLDERILERAGPDRTDRQAVQDLWNNSLFKRMWTRAAETVKVLLTTQYRSRSGIRNAISTLFYEGRLLPGRTDSSEKVPFPCSLVWVDTKGRREDQVHIRKSLVNDREARVIGASLDMLVHTLPDPAATSVAVICFYGEQRNLIDRVLRESPASAAFRGCEARTVDASQGGQWDVVILSLTRCDGGSAFVGNPNRLNVALSRARELAVVVGSLGYALRDRQPDSRLGSLARYVQDHKGNGVWICAPGPRGGIARGFGYRRANGRGA